MVNIKVLGSGCAKCNATAKLIEEAAKAKSVEIAVEKVENMAEILAYGVMSTPAVVVDGKLVHAGGMPARAAVDAWLDGQVGGGCGCGTGCKC